MIISFLFICFLLFSLVSLVVRLVLSLFLRRPKKGEESTVNHKKVGEVYVSSPSKVGQNKVVEKDMGEYVDFETVKEEK